MGEPGGQGADPVLSGSSTGEGGGEGVDPCSKYRRASLVSSQTRAGQEGRGTDALRQGEQILGQPWSECWPEGSLGWVGGGGHCHSSWAPLKQSQKRAEKAFLLPFQPRQNQYVLET